MVWFGGGGGGGGGGGRDVTQELLSLMTSKMEVPS